ncbi:hypothetical protein GPECTOR_776g952 [Gonium pectorale]|uniref:Ankyrin repeat domain-containing protein n=1 Tax=Gonium pectorale TaxID=33097 RepID=A0A150FV97_GONPE|nr:hypothetical protein GPECTOR_776g952 [Gonium pectorale]|eukprot:KXZ41115.1 hypothetical protein GPECTOR_776g952 [Gonium pectorale]
MRGCSSTAVGFDVNVMDALSQAASRGHLSVLQVMHDAGWQPNYAEEAARGGQLLTVAWLVQTLQVSLDGALFDAAARSSDVQLLAWLRERGCTWNGPTQAGIRTSSPYEAAAEAGSVEALEWLVQQGCPLPVSGNAYVTACSNGDLTTMCCLRRLGVPLQPLDRVLREAVQKGAPTSALIYLAYI